MNKNKRTRAVYAAFIFCVSTLFMACQTSDAELDGNTSEQYQEQEAVEGPFQKITMVSLEEIPRVTKFLKQRAQKDIFAKDEIAGAIFDDDNVKMAIDTLDQVSYSLRFTYPDRPGSVFYNLMVGVNADGSSKEPYVIKYVCHGEQYPIFEENDYNFEYFKGTISLHAFNDFFKASDFAKDCAGSNGDPAQCAQAVFIGPQTTTNVSQGYRGGGVTHTPSGLAGYDINIRVIHTIPDGRTFEYGSGSKCHHPKGCKVDMQITGGRKHLKSTGAGCADCGLPPTLSGVANLGRDFAGKINRALKYRLTAQETRWLSSNLKETVKIWAFLQKNGSKAGILDFANEAIKTLMDDREVDFEELYISHPTPDDNYIYQGPKQNIPNPLVLSNGDKISITFGTTQSDKINANQKVSIDLINGIKFALEEANKNLSANDKITSIHIHATTNGKHGALSNHPKSTAADISRINGQKMIISGVTNQIIELQKAMDKFQYMRENYGLNFRHKFEVEHNRWDFNRTSAGPHKDHIHFAVRR